MTSVLPDTPFVFSASAAAGGGYAPPRPSAAEDLVVQTRREIAEIVRETATLARRQLPRDQFFAAVVDRTVRALAAEGAVMWDVGEPIPTALVRIGRVTDREIRGTAQTVHRKLLAEIAAAGTPVVVPPTPLESQQPDAEVDLQADSLTPANPTHFPAAIVPIPDPLEAASASEADGPAARYLLEVFLESESGVATQRGYLRFTAQMADIAGDFLRLDEIRRGRRRETLETRMAELLPRIHRHSESAATAAEIVDAAAELFDAARATLVRLGAGPRPHRGAKILAISHVDAVDHRGEACRELLRQIVELELPGDAAIGFPAAEETEQEPESASPRELAGDAALYPLAAVAFGRDRRFRLLLQTDRPPAADAPEFDELQRRSLQRLARHAEAALAATARLQSIPLSRFWLSLRSGDPGDSLSPAARLRRAALWTAAAVLPIAVGMLPVSMDVAIPATLRPDGVRTHYAPCDAIVEAMSVRHGDSVHVGRPLVTLRDTALEEQTATLSARRALISEKLARVLASLVSSPSQRAAAGADARGDDDALVQQQMLLEEELQGIDRQLELLDEARERLILRADRDGRVDAWQVERTALGRPVRAGEVLLRVEPHRPRWLADAKVPQDRGSLVFERLGRRPDAEVRVRFDDAAGEASAKFVRHGVFEASPVGRPVAIVEFELAGGDDSGADVPWRSGTPAEVTIDCGKLPLVQVLFYDFLRSLRLQWARWT